MSGALWERTRTPSLRADPLDAYRRYVAALTAGYSRQPSLLIVPRRRSRLFRQPQVVRRVSLPNDADLLAQIAQATTRR